MEGKEILYTTQEAAQELGISYSYLRTLIANKVAQPSRQIGINWLFTSEDVERLRTSRRPPGRPKKQ